MLEIENKKLVLIEDDRGLREVLCDELSEKGVEVSAFSEIPRDLDPNQYDWLLMDLRVGSESSMDFLKKVRQQSSEIKIVMMSGFGSVASAVKAIQLGANNFISKPVTVDMILRAFFETEASPEEISKWTSTEETQEQEISLARMEREYIDYVLQTSDGNITQAAKKLGLHRQSLQRKLRKYIPRK